MEFTIPKQIADWLLVEVVLLIIGLIKISLENPSFVTTCL
jgi:hypothetical protein